MGGKKGGDRRDIIVETVNRPDENGITVCYCLQKWKWTVCCLFVPSLACIVHFYRDTDHHNFVLCAFRGSAVAFVF